MKTITLEKLSKWIVRKTKGKWKATDLKKKEEVNAKK